MQKLTGISSGQNKKSCRIIHHKSKKIGFTFFWFFCDFLRNVQETRKLTLLFQSHFCSRDPGKKCFFAMWPLGGRAAAVRPNSGEPPPGLAREGRGEGLGVTRARFGGSAGAGRGPVRGGAGGQAWWPPRPAVPVRWGSGGKTAHQRVRLGAREGGKSVYLDFRPAGPGVHRGCHPWHRRGSALGRRGVSRVVPLYGRPGSLQATTRDPRRV
jgi:hypothetical protein